MLGGPGALERRAGEVADRVIVLPYLRRPLVSLGDVWVFWTLVRLASEYDVVHTHGWKAGVMGRLAARARRVPVVVHTVHGFPVHPLMPRPVRAALLALERMAARAADRIVCVCDANAREALELGIAEPEQVRVIVSGVPEQAVADGRGDACRAALGIPADAPVVGTVTRLMEQKAPLDFVAAARRILAERPDAHVLLVGDGHLRAQVEPPRTCLGCTCWAVGTTSRTCSPRWTSWRSARCGRVSAARSPRPSSPGVPSWPPP
ncbi:MAG TPA: glycosyltransferase [Mycobacteriales bacterium]|nr:glycosyltransferase [Mycobacteriales bacterium]